MNLPMTVIVIEIKGELHVKDAHGVCMPIPEKENDFNCVNFDFVIDEEKEHDRNYRYKDDKGRQDQKHDK